MRLFIAIRLSRPLVETLKQAQRDMRHQGAEGNFSREENLHLTLAFLGETEDAAGALSAMEEVSRGGAIRLAVSGVGRFGDLWWAGVEENLRLKTAAENLQSALRRRGFSIEKRAFRPHVTLARQVRSPRPLRLSVPRREMTAAGMSLMKSERIGGKLTYTEIGYVPF